MPGSAAAASISGRVTVPSSRSVPRALPVRSGGPATSRTSSSSWKARPTSAAERPQALVVAAEQAGALEQLRRLQPAAVEVALLGDPRGRRRRGAGPARRGRARPTASASSSTARASPASASRAKAREKSRSPVATARARPEVAATVGRPRRSGASSRTSSWTRVAMWTSSIAVAGPHRGGAAALAGAEQDQHRPQPLAARRQGRRRRPRRAARRGRRPPPAAFLDLAQPRRQPAARRVEDRRHRRRHGRASGHPRTPLWIAMIPPASTV